MIRVYLTRYDKDAILKCVTENPDFEIEQIQRATKRNYHTVAEALRQLQDEGIISDVEA